MWPLVIGGIAIVAAGFAVLIFRPEICTKIPKLPLLCDQPIEDIPIVEEDFFESDVFPPIPFTSVQQYSYLDVYSQKPVIAHDVNVMNACLQKCGSAGTPATLECMAECHSGVIAHQELF